MRLTPKEQEKLMLHMAGNLAKERKERVVKEYGKGLYNCSVVVENEKDALAAIQ